MTAVPAQVRSQSKLSAVVVNGAELYTFPARLARLFLAGPIAAPTRWRGASSYLIGKFCRLLKDLYKHFASQLARLRVLIGRVVAGQQIPAIG
jgi:hypothetical protein